MAVSLEVGEHLPKRSAGRLVDLLTTLSPVVVFSAATPGQGATGHVNEQPHAYWITRFAARGFVMDRVLSDHWRSEWETQGVASRYFENVLVFRDSHRQAG